ncbi:MAG: PilT/PilU family type 4a pilus ATPase [Deltaproteobacteria bacterium]|nr:PilT/PilU family type 4a pilus ATPase [Deltaproteobacteria bacterium]
MVEKFDSLIKSAFMAGVSDIHLTGGHPVAFRINGILQYQPDLDWKSEEIDDLVRSLLSPWQIKALRERQSIDCALSFIQSRLRINIFYTTRGFSLAIRILPANVPSIEQLNLHPSLKEISKLRSGLILIGGPTGVGKTSTIAALVNEINHHRSSHIITLEDPIEYRQVSRESFIEQRELGLHMPAFEQGLLDVLREDPDVIVVGEIRDPETIKLTLNIAESGHLVITTLHSNTSEEALHRILNAFSMDAQDDIRNRLASTLVWLIIQDLIYLEKFGFRVPLLSILRGNQSVKSNIREDKLHQIENIIQLGKAEGMFTKDRYLKEYLLAQKDLYPPQKAFQPSQESNEEIEYHSPIMEPYRYFSSRDQKSEPPLSESESLSPQENRGPTISRDSQNLHDFIHKLNKDYK